MNPTKTATAITIGKHHAPDSQAVIAAAATTGHFNNDDLGQIAKMARRADMDLAEVGATGQTVAELWADIFEDHLLDDEDED